jgi:hypothetical protein
MTVCGGISRVVRAVPLPPAGWPATPLRAAGAGVCRHMERAGERGPSPTSTQIHPPPHPPPKKEKRASERAEAERVMPWHIISQAHSASVKLTGEWNGHPSVQLVPVA